MVKYTTGEEIEVGDKISVQGLEGMVGYVDPNIDKYNEKYKVFFYNNSRSGTMPPSSANVPKPLECGYQYSYIYWHSDCTLVEKVKNKQNNQNEKTGGTMLNCIAKNFVKTQDALLVEKHFGREWKDDILTMLLVSQFRNEILAEAISREAKETKLKESKKE